MRFCKIWYINNKNHRVLGFHRYLSFDIAHPYPSHYQQFCYRISLIRSTYLFYILLDQCHIYALEISFKLRSLELLITFLMLSFFSWFDFLLQLLAFLSSQSQLFWHAFLLHFCMFVPYHFSLLLNLNVFQWYHIPVYHHQLFNWRAIYDLCSIRRSFNYKPINTY